MTNQVGLDVPRKTTVLCVVDGGGHLLWCGECTSSPDQICSQCCAGPDASIGIETVELQAQRRASVSSRRTRGAAGPAGAA
jgi:hypothetical protein